MALYVKPAVYDAWTMKEAIYGLGTDERALIEVLMTRTNAQIQEMKEVRSASGKQLSVDFDSHRVFDLVEIGEKFSELKALQPSGCIFFQI